jgi:hypothetical protein
MFVLFLLLGLGWCAVAHSSPTLDTRDATRALLALTERSSEPP